MSILARKECAAVECSYHDNTLPTGWTFNEEKGTFNKNNISVGLLIAENSMLFIMHRKRDGSDSQKEATEDYRVVECFIHASSYFDYSDDPLFVNLSALEIGNMMWYYYTSDQKEECMVEKAMTWSGESVYMDEMHRGLVVKHVMPALDQLNVPKDVANIITSYVSGGLYNFIRTNQEELDEFNASIS